jgi:uncharacterized protein
MKKLLILTFAIAIFLSACKDPDNSCATNFDQSAFLSNIANNIITPWYDSLKLQVDALSLAVANFNASPSQQTLDVARSAYRNAGLIWQKAMIFEFGPADEVQLRSSLNNFPVFEGRLEYAAQGGKYKLEVDSFSYTRGFPAIDYLLYAGAADDAGIIALFDTDSNAQIRRNFLTAVMAQIKGKTDAVHSGWATYKSTFIATIGVSTGSPISLLVNQLNQNYELFKNNKLGNPVGAKVSYIPSPDKVEAKHSGLSLDFAMASLHGTYELFMGKDGSGFDDYIAAGGSEKDGQPLQNVIINQFNTITASLEALRPETLNGAIQTNFNAVKTAYGQAQNQVVYLKTDLPSVLCISITYVDNTDDGD